MTLVELESDLEKIRRRWQCLGIRIRTGLSAGEIEEFEKKRGVQLPWDAKCFFRCMDGMEYGEWDEEFISFWSLSKVETVPNQLSLAGGIPDYRGIESLLPDAKSCFIFADYSIMMHVYAMRLSPNAADDSPIIRIFGREWQEMAPSFGEFLKRYAVDPWSVW